MEKMGQANKPDENKVYDLPLKARQHVLKHINSRVSHMGDQIMTKDVYIVWFSKTLQNWKALVSTTADNDLYYEVTYDGDKKLTHIDVYTQIGGTIVHD